MFFGNLEPVLSLCLLGLCVHVVRMEGDAKTSMSADSITAFYRRTAAVSSRRNLYVRFA